jgi:hypothetical protein
MLGINQTGLTMPACNLQGRQTQDKPVLKTLNRDMVSFSGLFNKKPVKPEYVSQAAYDAVSKYVQDNPHTYAGKFLSKIKVFCERGFDEVAELDAQIFARKIEQERIKEVSELLKQVKTSLKESLDKSLLKELLDDYNKILGTGSLR